MKTTSTFKSLPHAFLMRVVLCLFGVFFSSQAYAQHEDVLDKTWYLYKLEIDGEEYEYYSLEMQAGDEARIKVVVENDSNTIIQVDGCPRWGCDFYIEFIENENKFFIIDKLCLASDFCRNYNDYHIDYDVIASYYGNFYENFDSIVECSFETIDAIEYLIFTDENNDKLYYTAENLSVADFEEVGFSIYPNPAQDWLHIHIEELSNNTNLEVYDIHGKLLENFMLSKLETQLDVSEYASGIYFIKMTDELGSRQVKKFIKR